MPDLDRTALVVVDFQQAVDLAPEHFGVDGRRDNPDCDRNVVALVEAWRAADRPVVFVRHDSTEPGSPLAPGAPGNAFKDALPGEPDVLVAKRVNSSFHGEPDLDRWLRERDVDGFAICGITTNHCVETTARVGANLGWDVLFVADACHTFDRRAPDGAVVPAEELARATVTSLHGEFATVLNTRDLG